MTDLLALLFIAFGVGFGIWFVDALSHLSHLGKIDDVYDELKKIRQQMESDARDAKRKDESQS